MVGIRNRKPYGSKPNDVNAVINAHELDILILTEFSQIFFLRVPEYPSIIVLGDFNLHFNETTTSEVQTFADPLISAGCIPIIDLPTHKAGNTLDQIFALNPSDVRHLTSFDIKFSDQGLKTLSFKTAVPIEIAEIYYRKWNKINFINLEHDYSTTLYLSLLHPPKHFDDFFSIIMDSIESICYNYAPLQLKPAKVRKFPFLTMTLKNDKQETKI